jgi:hypothetical protein
VKQTGFGDASLKMFPMITHSRHFASSLSSLSFGQVLQEVSTASVENIQTAANEWIFGNASRRAVFMMMCSKAHETDLHKYAQKKSEEDRSVFFQASQSQNEVKFNDIEDLSAAKRFLLYPN